MKVYVLNVESETERLKNFAKNYPSCLPEYSVWKAKTGADVDTPDWWQSSANRWALVQNFIDILSTDTDEDILIFEDDCTFAEDFEDKYNAFLNEVPDDWDMLYLGAQHTHYPTQVSTGVLQLKDSICGHAIIYRNSIKQSLVEYYQEPNWGCKHMPDQRRAQAMASGKFKAYSPLLNICGQSAGYSLLSNKDRHARWYNDFTYIDLDSKRRNSILGYIDPVKNGVVYVGLRGGLGNCLLNLGLGKWAESKGLTVKYYDYSISHDKCIFDLLPKFDIGLAGKKLFNLVNFGYLDKEKQLRYMQKSCYCKCSWHPECLSYLGMDHVSTDNAIGIHVRRGDYLSPAIAHTNWGLDLCNTKYFANVKQAIAKYDLPIKIFSDDLDAIPNNIKELFPDAEYISSNTLDDFNALSACKVIVTYGSTFSGCAACLNTDAIVYCPPNLFRAFRKTDWNVVSLT